jgi:hypothetical protein
MQRLSKNQTAMSQEDERRRIQQLARLAQQIRSLMEGKNINIMFINALVKGL